MVAIEAKEVYNRSDKPALAFWSCYLNNIHKVKSKQEEKELIKRSETAATIKLAEEMFKPMKE